MINLFLKTTIILFATDAQCLLFGPNLNEFLSHACYEITKINDWFINSRLAINVQSKKFFDKRRKVTHVSNFYINIVIINIIDRKECVKFLG